MLFVVLFFFVASRIYERHVHVLNAEHSKRFAKLLPLKQLRSFKGSSFKGSSVCSAYPESENVRSRRMSGGYALHVRSRRCCEAADLKSFVGSATTMLRNLSSDGDCDCDRLRSRESAASQHCSKLLRFDEASSCCATLLSQNQQKAA